MIFILDDESIQAYIHQEALNSLIVLILEFNTVDITIGQAKIDSYLGILLNTDTLSIL